MSLSTLLFAAPQRRLRAGGSVSGVTGFLQTQLQLRRHRADTIKGDTRLHTHWILSLKTRILSDPNAAAERGAAWNLISEIYDQLFIHLLYLRCC